MTVALYANDRARADEHEESIIAILRPLMPVLVAPPLLDEASATDFWSPEVKIAARVRGPNYFDRFPGQFTLRYSRASGKETEYSKIRQGKGDWLFYSEQGVERGTIGRWMVIDLANLRVHLDEADRTSLVSFKWGVKPNQNDGGRTSFIWFDAFSFSPPQIIMAKHEKVLGA